MDFLNSFLSFLTLHKNGILISLFYLILILIIYLNRKKFQIQAYIIAMYRTKFGINKIHSFAKKNSELIKILGYIGIGIGFVGILVISFFMLDGLWKLFTTPDAPPAVTPVIPGVKIPGSPIFVPFWYGIIALFIVVLVHEFAHGIVAAAHGLKVKSTGIVFFGPLIGAFVEPDEKEIKKKTDVEQYSIFAAGPFSNILLAGVAILLTLFALAPLHSLMTEETGVGFTQIQNNTPAYSSGLYADMTIIKADDTNITGTKDFENFLAYVRPNQTIQLYSDKGENFTLTTAAHPDNPKKGYLGVIGVHTQTKLIIENTLFKIMDTAVMILTQLFMWVYILSLGIGLANLLPIGPVDGGRMVQVASQKLAKTKEQGNRIWQKITLATILVLLILVFVPIIRGILKL